MRIFYAVPNTPHEGSLPQSKIWYFNLYLPLLELGHTLTVFDIDYGPYNYNLDPSQPERLEFIQQHRPLFGIELLRQVKEAHHQQPIDLFFSYFYSAYVEAEVISEIRRMGIKTVNFYANASYQLNLVEEIAPAFDYCLVPEKFRLEDYRRIGANPIYCQEAANPNIYKPYAVPQVYDVTFVGQKYATRPMYIRRLLDADIDARAWGPHWQEPQPKPQRQPKWRTLGRAVKYIGRSKPPIYSSYIPPERCGPPLDDEALIQMYSRSKISLGFSAVAKKSRPGEQPIKQVRLRDFEAPMSGAFYMVEQFDELAEFFEPGKEIVFFADPEDLIDKARYYLRHAVEREHIRQAGMRRARADHTWHKRFQDVFRQMGLA